MKTHRFLIALAVGSAALLAGCSDGLGMANEPTGGAQVPASATASVAAYTEYTGSLPKTETGLPLGVNGVIPPTSESAAPATI